MQIARVLSLRDTLLWPPPSLWGEGNMFVQVPLLNQTMLQLLQFSSIQFSSVTQLYLTLCNPTDCSTLGLPVQHQLPESTQTHVHWIGDAIQPPYLLSSPSPPTSILPQQQGLFKWVSSLHQVAKILEFQLQHQSFQWTPRTDLL